MDDRFKFRAKDKKTGEWVYGAYLKHLKRTPGPIGDKTDPIKDYAHLIVYSGSSDWNLPCPIVAKKVWPETVGQCTGLKDKNGRWIYEGDIVLNGFHNNLIEWFKGGFWINGFVNGAKWNIHITHDSLEVIGNVHETPKLLEKKK